MSIYGKPPTCETGRNNYGQVQAIGIGKCFEDDCYEPDALDLDLERRMKPIEVPRVLSLTDYLSIIE